MEKENQQQTNTSKDTTLDDVKKFLETASGMDLYEIQMELDKNRIITREMMYY